MDPVSIWVISGQRFAKLLQRPVRCGMGGHIVMHDPARPDFQDHEHVEDAEGCGHDHKEVTGYPLGILRTKVIQRCFGSGVRLGLRPSGRHQ